MLMPITATVATVAAGAMAGVPLLNGFLSKEMFFAESIVAGDASGLEVHAAARRNARRHVQRRLLAAIHSSACSSARCREICRARLREPTRGMLLPSAVLVVACLLVGTIPAQTVGPVLAVAARSILGATLPQYELAVWHGFNAPLVMSSDRARGGIAVLCGSGSPRPHDGADAAAVALECRADIRHRQRRGSSGARAAHASVVSLASAAAAAAHRLRSARRGLSAAARSWAGPAASVPSRRSIPCLRCLWVAGAACAIGAAVQAKFHRLAALILVGGVGLVTCLTFAWFSAPDLALTQIAVEVVTLVLILLGLAMAAQTAGRARSLAAERCAPASRRGRDLTVAVARGPR